MRTTLEIDDALFRRAKTEAAERGISLKGLVTEALRTLLDKPKSKVRYRAKLPIVNGRRPPAIDPADRNALYDFLDKNS